jgi:hypothetical protein
MQMDADIDIDYLKDSLKLSAEERFIMCAEFSEFCASFNQHYLHALENDNPDIFALT